MTGAPTSRDSRAPQSPPPRAPGIDIADTGQSLTPEARAWLIDRATRGVALVACSGDVRVRVLGDDAMAEAHLRFGSGVGTTDVLTFDLSDEPPGSPATPDSPSQRHLDADILVCVDEARRQGAARGHEPARELLLYIIHGALHCLGHDDHDEAAAARMHAVEDRILESLGVGAIYARPALGSATPRGGSGAATSGTVA